MKKDIKDFLCKVHSDFQFSKKINSNEVRWRQSDGDVVFFNKCASRLKKLGVKLILDMACGGGQFVKICNENYKIETYGIDPLYNEYSNIYQGTFSSVIDNQKMLGYKSFDCITLHNTLHGKGWKDDEVMNLLNFMMRHSKYIVISDPIQNPNVTIPKEITQVHLFDKSHGGKTVLHKIYGVFT
jgi:2-polyprenyl-3-methyl-5-hydroxy-6-metoxy-1,4-benzoquinol methylase